MTDYSRSFPVLTHDVVTQGHADYCAAHGHAAHTVDGVVSPWCPRCGDSFPDDAIAADRAADERSDEIAAARAADERIADLWAAYWAADQEQAGPVRSQLADTRRSLKLEKGRRTPDADRVTYLEGREAATLEQLRAVVKGIKPLSEAARNLDRELYAGWTRFYLVEHIHNTTACSSFRPTTRVGWLPKVSGLTEVEAVAEYGAILCTKCFPTAPVELTNGSPKLAADDDTCPGSGQAFDPEQPNTARLYYGPTATCPACGELVGLKSRGSRLVRKHKRP